MYIGLTNLMYLYKLFLVQCPWILIYLAYNIKDKNNQFNMKYFYIYLVNNNESKGNQFLNLAL